MGQPTRQVQQRAPAPLRGLARNGTAQPAAQGERHEYTTPHAAPTGSSSSNWYAGSQLLLGRQDGWLRATPLAAAHNTSPTRLMRGGASLYYQMASMGTCMASEPRCTLATSLSYFVLFTGEFGGPAIGDNMVFLWPLHVSWATKWP